MREIWGKCIEPGENLTVDETLYAYQASDKEKTEAPVRYIPRKPCKNGLKVFYLACKTVRKLPYLLDLELDHDLYNHLNPRTALFRFMNRWNRSYQPHIIVDAGFSGEDIVPIATDFNCHLTASINVAHKRWLYDLLCKICRTNHFVAVQDSQGNLVL